MKNQIALCCALALLLGADGTRAAGDGKATDVLTAARKAIGDKKLDALKTLSVEASVQRNVNTMQMTSDVEILLELPDKYVRSEVGSGPMSMTMSSGFIGDKAIRPANATSMAGGAMIIRMGPGPGPGGPMPSGEKPTPEEQERIDRQMLRSARADISRLMLGWFASTHPALAADYTYAGEAESPDGKADVIDARNADGFSARLFIDRESHLPLMVTYQGPQPRMTPFRTKELRQLGDQPGSGRLRRAFGGGRSVDAPGVDDAFVERFRGRVPPGTSALCMVVAAADRQRLLSPLGSGLRHAELVETNLSPEDEAGVRAMLADV